MTVYARHSVDTSRAVSLVLTCKLRETGVSVAETSASPIGPRLILNTTVTTKAPGNVGALSAPLVAPTVRCSLLVVTLRW